MSQSGPRKAVGISEVRSKEVIPLLISHGQAAYWSLRMPKEGGDVGKATVTGRVFPFYTCQKKLVTHWMGCLTIQKILQSPVILAPIYFRNFIQPWCQDNSQGVGSTLPCHKCK